MTVTTDKITDTVGARLGAARHMAQAKMLSTAVPAGKKAKRQAAVQASKQMQQARTLIQDRLVPMASSAVDNAMVASEPVRREAVRRGKLAAAALRGADSMIVARKQRRWPVAVAFLAVGSAIGAVVAWLSQAGRPVQLAPYPLASEPDEPQSLDLSAEEREHHHQQ